jgi:DNA-cytosine methyltransferase
MNVLSLFDGMSCGQIALDKLGLKVDNYFASEIDKYAIQVTQNNFPETKQLGCVTKIKADYLPKIDLLIGGSPCQGFSSSGKGLNFNDPRSKLFFEFVRLLKEIKPKYYLLENVRMKKEYENIITEYLGVKPININSKHFTGQNRSRLYWTNINIDSYDLKTIELEFNPELFNKVKIVPFVEKKISMFSNLPKFFNPYNLSDLNIAPTLQSQGNRQTNSSSIFCKIGSDYFMANSSYWEKLQGVPKNYTSGYSENIRKNLLGNGWTVDVITHIFKGMKICMFRNELVGEANSCLKVRNFVE